MPEPVIIEAVRTPFGRRGGALREVRPVPPLFVMHIDIEHGRLASRRCVTLRRHANDQMTSFDAASPSGFMVEDGCEEWEQRSRIVDFVPDLTTIDNNQFAQYVYGMPVPEDLDALIEAEVNTFFDGIVSTLKRACPS